MGKRVKKLALLGAILGLGITSITSKIHNDAIMQRENPRIALDRKGVFTPLFNDILYAGVNPFGYNIKPKLRDFIPNLLFDREHKVPQREDAWRLYLGKPQINNTFSISKYSPQGSNEVCYNLRDFLIPILHLENLQTR